MYRTLLMPLILYIKYRMIISFVNIVVNKKSPRAPAPLRA